MIKRNIRMEGAVAYISLTKGYTAIIDTTDVHLVDRWHWCAMVCPRAIYARRSQEIDGKAPTALLHRVIVAAPYGLDVDHISGDGLDNRRANLRLATRSQNIQNQGIGSRNTSGFKGVTWLKQKAKWKAQIGFEGSNRHLGLFTDINDAAAAYAAASKQLHGQFGRTA